MPDALFELTLADKLYRTRYEPDTDHPHITVDEAICRTCDTQPCVQMCPADVYKRDLNDEKRVVVSHDNCLECGTCIQVCPLGSVDWSFPDGGMGVKYRFG